MVQYPPDALDTAFAALSDATRRGILRHLARAEASISELAERFAMTLTGMKKHVAMLEKAGLVATQKVGRVRTCRLDVAPLTAQSTWINELHTLWDQRFAALDAVVIDLKSTNKDP